ncbi:iron chelate uptake ABC transporter family permease subunit [Providencia rettgeri]|nr:iron chelate uptake ABC transporter family permease subunit [Providencia rettgeri]
MSSYRILLWLSGSTYRGRATGHYFSISVVVLTILAITLNRWLVLLSISRTFAQGRGLNSQLATILLLILVALLCAFVTSTVGPIAFLV